MLISKHSRPPPQTSSAQLNFLNAFGNNLQNSYNSPPSYNPPANNNNFNSINNNNNNEDPDVITINNQGPFNTGRDPDVIVGDPRAVDPGEILGAGQCSHVDLNLCHCGNLVCFSPVSML